MKFTALIFFLLSLLFSLTLWAAEPQVTPATPANVPAEIGFTLQRPQADPSNEVTP